MSGDNCDVCNAREARLLHAVSLYCQVDYYRCDRCGHVWTVPKWGDRKKRRAVTRTLPDTEASE